jgi:hypothetical protein
MKKKLPLNEKLEGKRGNGGTRTEAEARLVNWATIVGAGPKPWRRNRHKRWHKARDAHHSQEVLYACQNP